MTELIFAVDPGNERSAYVSMREDDYKPLDFGKFDNELVREKLLLVCAEQTVSTVVIERVASYGMAVGATVFETCEWVGRFAEIAHSNNIPVEYVYRKDEKITLCHNLRAKDANIRRALIDRFAKHDLNNGRGTKNNPDWFSGFAADVWSAYAVGTTFMDMRREQNTLKWDYIAKH